MEEGLLTEKMRTMGLRVVDLAKYMEISRPTLYKYMKMYDEGQKDAIPASERAVFDLINSGTAGKSDIIKFIFGQRQQETASMMASAAGSPDAATALMIAAMAGNAEVVKLLIQAGAKGSFGKNGIGGLGESRADQINSTLMEVSMNMPYRFLAIRNYRNIGASNNADRFEKFYLNSSLCKKDIGDLRIVIGENNIGKSNVLAALNVITGLDRLQHVPLKASDSPYFMDYDDDLPEVRLVYADVGGKSFFLRYFLNDEGDVQVCLESGGNSFEIARIKRQLDEESIEAIRAEFDDKFEYENRIEDYCRRYGAAYSKELAAIKKAYGAIMKKIAEKHEDGDIETLKDIHGQLKELIESYMDEYNANSWNRVRLIGPDFINLDDAIYFKIENEASAQALEEATKIDLSLKETYGISLVPNVAFYKEKEIKDGDLVTTPEQIKDSKFFNSLFRAVGKNIGTVAQTYERAKRNPDFKNDYSKSINKKLEEIVSKKFNELYFQGLPSQEYSFSITFEKEQIYLGIRKNGNSCLLSQQSTGFRWFFNFFFNFLYSNDLQPGDIVLMDEPEIHLAIPAKQDLRKFIKDFAKHTGITFVATTQHPEFVDYDFLDELRIVMQKKGEGEVGAAIENDFSAIAEDASDTIDAILAAFGVHHRDIITNPGNKVIYVEGLIDYNYLTAFKLLKEEEEGKKIGIAFLPFKGLGEDDAQMKRRRDLLLSKHLEAFVLADSDAKGAKFAGICEEDAQVKDRLHVFQLKDADEGFIEIEDLFAPADKERYKEMIEGKIGSASALFKRNILELSEKGEIDGQTKANFYKVLDYLVGVN